MVSSYSLNRQKEEEAILLPLPFECQYDTCFDYITRTHDKTAARLHLCRRATLFVITIRYAIGRRRFTNRRARDRSDSLLGSGCAVADNMP